MEDRLQHRRQSENKLEAGRQLQTMDDNWLHNCHCLIIELTTLNELKQITEGRKEGTKERIKEGKKEQSKERRKEKERKKQA